MIPKRAPIIAPKVEMTAIWLESKISPPLWRELQVAQDFADVVMGPDMDAYPTDATDRDLVFLSHHMPTTMALAMLRRRLVRGLALRKLAASGMVIE